MEGGRGLWEGVGFGGGGVGAWVVKALWAQGLDRSSNVKVGTLGSCLMMGGGGVERLMGGGGGGRELESSCSGYGPAYKL